MPNFWWSPTNHLYRGGDKRPCADAVRLVPESAEHQRKADMVADFCTERAEYITAINNCHPSNMDDYWRWQGHAEARRQLAERLMGVGLLPSKPLPAADSSAHVVRTIAAMFASTNRQHMAEWLTDTADAIEREVPWPKLEPKPADEFEWGCRTPAGRIFWPLAYGDADDFVKGDPKSEIVRRTVGPWVAAKPEGEKS